MGDLNDDFKSRFIKELMYLLLTMLYKYLMVYYVRIGLIFSPILAKHMILCRGLIT